MPYQTATIYFMSGTGNSFRAATWIAEAAQGQGADAQAVPIGNGRPAEEIQEGEAHLLGLVMPTHGFTTPWQMLRFALRLPRRKGTHALVMPTRAGSKLGPVFLPGLEGTAGYLPALILALKGYRVRGVRGLDMPSNWTALHPGFSQKSAEAIIARSRPKALRFADTILSGKPCFGSLVGLVLGLVLLPVSLGYLLAGRLFLGRLFFASYRCDGCGVCAKNCPAGAIEMKGKKEVRPYWTHRCENCMRCMNYCPKNAVEAGHSWAVMLYYVTAIPVSEYVLNRLGNRVRWLITADAEGDCFASLAMTGKGECHSRARLARLKRAGIGMVLQYGYMLVAISAAYSLFAVAIRVPAINRLFAVTTLTHYYRRYHEPETRLKDMAAKDRV